MPEIPISVSLQTPDVIVMQQRNLGEHRALVTPIAQFRAGNFIQDIISGANNYTSGYNLLSGVASSIVRIRPINIFMQNRDAGAMTVLFRDGGLSGAQVAGPYIINPVQERIVKADELAGAFFTSSVYALVISGTFANGIVTRFSYVLDPQEYYE